MWVQLGELASTAGRMGRIGSNAHWVKDDIKYKALLATSTSPASQADVALAEQFNRTMSFKPELFLVLRMEKMPNTGVHTQNGPQGAAPKLC